MTEIAEPVDELHMHCLWARDQVRSQAGEISQRIAAWFPAPMPDGWVAEDRALEPRDPTTPYLDEVPIHRPWFRS